MEGSSHLITHISRSYLKRKNNQEIIVSMDERVIFTSATTGTVSNIHSLNQSNLRQCQAGGRFSSCIVKQDYLFVAQSKKALIQIYNLHGSTKRESVEQRLPVPEVLQCIECIDDTLLLGATEGGKLYIWELASGSLLNVKLMAHYQGIVKIKSICHGKYIVTAGKDARLIFWQLTDLLQNDEPKPLYIIHDHSLPITDFAFSNTLGHSLDGRLFSVSEDMTLRCYQLSVNYEPRCIATFTFPSPLSCLSLDPADRCIYVGTSSGVIKLPLYYNVTPNKLMNLIQSTESKIYSVIEKLPGTLDDVTTNKEQLMTMGQLLCERICEMNACCLSTSMDGSLLIIGDDGGKCTILEIFSKQPIREIQPLSTDDFSGSTTSLLTFPIKQESESLLEADKINKGWKFPNLQRAILGREGKRHDVQVQFNHMSSKNVLPISDFNKFLSEVASEENIFHKVSGINSEVKRVSLPAPKETNKNGTESGERQDTKDQEIAKLKKTVAQLTDAYKELRGIHDDLLQQHQKLSQNK